MKLFEIAEAIGGELVGDGTVIIQGIGDIERAREGELSFIADRRYLKFLDTTRASAVIVPQQVQRASKPIIRVKDPYLSFIHVLKLFYPPKSPLEPGIHPTAVISETTSLGEEVAIGAHVVIGERCRLGRGVKIFPGTFIGDDVQIGEGSVIYPNVSIMEGTVIGNNVIIHAGTVIGSDGFGFVKRDGKHLKIPQVGRVVIEDDVEVGANCTIDRATLGETRIKRGTKLDNLIQVAHNVEIGEDTVIAAQVGISGSTRIGRGVTVAGQVGFVDHIEIGDNTVFGAQAGVTKSVPPNTVVSGYPAKPHQQAKREEAALRRLPELIKRVRELERKVKRLETHKREERGYD